MFIHSVHELEDRFLTQLGVTVFKGAEGGPTHDRGAFGVEVVFLEQLADFHLDELQQLFIIDLVALVEENDEIRHTNLPGKQHVLARLRHRPVSSGHYQNTPFHLRGTGNHVLDVVGVAGAVHVAIVAVFGFVFHCGGVNGNASGLLLRSLVNCRVILKLCKVLFGECLGNCCCQRGLAMVDVADSSDVEMRFGSIELGRKPA
mmetsp:Transcript_31375/g.55166  ORF Transcript_31375/g.55166 Transcript_31375/m.55166 type:complete len:203 (-) Transcript_31375:81-689(-)